MSGGSFEYVCFAAESAGEIFNKLDQVGYIEKWLRVHSKHDAADEVLLYLKEMETHQRRIETIGTRIADLLQAVEWTASSDTSIAAVDLAYWKLMGIAPPQPPAP